jgi:hypothetical protein
MGTRDEVFSAGLQFRNLHGQMQLASLDTGDPSRSVHAHGKRSLGLKPREGKTVAATVSRALPAFLSFATFKFVRTSFSHSEGA